ncbi:MAG: flagellar type III secretion system pore protein FliP [Candidatus Sumerlaeota bacterium]|nr:flagellar type III secretion system pore protein FliP [Candidatus Sumerlaeota bacterium]
MPGQLTLNFGGGGRQQWGALMKILAAFTVLTLAPSILIMMTSFTRIVVVLSFVRRAIGLQEAPPTQVIIGLALFLTFFTMAPTWNKVYHGAIVPYMREQMNEEEAFDQGMAPIREFMFKHTRKDELRLFVTVAKVPRPRTRDDVPSYVLLPAFMISEIKTAFIIGFLIFIPFLVIDMVVSSILLAIGMMMLPPVIVSLPFKIILFVLVDGWALIVSSLIQSYQ